MIHRAGQIEIEIEGHEHRLVLVVAGELDACTAPQLGAVLERVVREHPCRVLVDLSEVSFMDSHGLVPLVQANTMAWPDTIFAVVAVGAAARPLRLTGLDSTMAVYPHRRMALACTAAGLA